MKTKEELNELKGEVEALKGKLAELTEEELFEVTGGFALNTEGEKLGYNVAIFPGLSALP